MLICAAQTDSLLWRRFFVGVRGPQLFTAKIPLTPGPLVVVIKPAQAQAFNASGASYAELHSLRSQHYHCGLAAVEHCLLCSLIGGSRTMCTIFAGPQPYWPPRDPDQIEAIAASYVQPGSEGSLRLFNLSPDTKRAGGSRCYTYCSL